MSQLQDQVPEGKAKFPTHEAALRAALAPAAIADIGHDRAWWAKEAARVGSDWPGVVASALWMLARAGVIERRRQQ
jgi:hypothetical protein